MPTKQKKPGTVAAREYARRRGVSHTAVQIALREGRITADAAGRIDPDQADKDWEQNTDPSKPRATTAGAREGSAPPPKGPAAFALSRARREEIRADREALDLAIRRGQLVAVADVAREVEDRVMRARTKAYAAVDSFGPAIIAASNMEAARAVALAVLEEFLATVSRGTDDDDGKPERKKTAKRSK